MKEIEELKDTLDSLVDSSNDLNILIEFEEVLDNLNIYSYKNWEFGEVIAGPEVTKYWITVTLMYPYKMMPDPDGAMRLTKHGARVFFGKETFIEPKKIESPDDLMAPDENGKRKPLRVKKPKPYKRGRLLKSGITQHMRVTCTGRRYWTPIITKIDRPD